MLGWIITLFSIYLAQTNETAKDEQGLDFAASPAANTGGVPYKEPPRDVRDFPSSTFTSLGTLDAKTPKISINAYDDPDKRLSTFSVKFNSHYMLQKQIIVVKFSTEGASQTLELLDRLNTTNEEYTVVESLSSESGNSLAFLITPSFREKMLGIYKYEEYYFRLRTLAGAEKAPFNFSIEFAERVPVPLRIPYSIYPDYNETSKQTRFVVDMTYDGATLGPDVSRLHFQFTAVDVIDDDEILMAGSVEFNYATLGLNRAYRNILGGSYESPHNEICNWGTCRTYFELIIKNVRRLEVESHTLITFHTIDMQTAKEVYDRTIFDDTIYFYQIPYRPARDGKHLNIALHPVTGSPSLFIGTENTTNVSSYPLKETGSMAKRVVIDRGRTDLLDITNATIFLAVKCHKAGEFLLTLEWSDDVIQGKLAPGFSEQAHLVKGEIKTWVYEFAMGEALNTTISLTSVTGQAVLFARVFDGEPRALTAEDLGDEKTWWVDDSRHLKELQLSLTCESEESLCVLGVGAFARDSPTNVNIHVSEKNSHLFLTPGHTIVLDLLEGQLIYFRFSVSFAQASRSAWLHVNYHYGEFEVYVDKVETYPNVTTASMVLKYPMSDNKDLYYTNRAHQLFPSYFEAPHPQGLYYVTVNATKSCGFSIKQYEKSDRAGDFHTIVAGEETRADISDPEHIVYFSLRISPHLATKNERLAIKLTPFKGEFIILANTNGIPPNKTDFAFKSENHYLELPAEVEKSEVVIAVYFHHPGFFDRNENYEFALLATMKGRSIKLQSGVVLTQPVGVHDEFYIEVLNEFEKILIVKSIKDGFNMVVCVNFNTSLPLPSKDHCEFTIRERQTGLFFDSAKLEKYCPIESGRRKCRILMRLEGIEGQSYSLGFVANDRPFHLVKHQMFQAPSPNLAGQRINLLHHIEVDEPGGLYFNSKGRPINVYCKLVSPDEYENQGSSFPDQNDYDDSITFKQGYITNIVIDELRIKKYIGTKAELLISIIPEYELGEEPFAVDAPFFLQTSVDARELVRTEILKDNLQDSYYNYYSLYNSGQSKELRIYIHAGLAVKLDVWVGLGLLSRVPFLGEQVLNATGIQSVELSLNRTHFADPAQFQGHFILTVRSQGNTSVDIYWSNKDTLNYFELTPNHPSTLRVSKGVTTYFSFSAKNDTRFPDEIFLLSFRATTSAAIFVAASQNKELVVPGQTLQDYSATTSRLGGISLIEIKPSDEHYCVNCAYVGSITGHEGEVTVLVSTKTERLPKILSAGASLTDIIPPDRGNVYKVYNPDKEFISLSVSVMNGAIDITITSELLVAKRNYTMNVTADVESGLHKFIVIDPAKFMVDKEHDFYIEITSRRDSPALVTLSVDKNAYRSPIIPGIRKLAHLAPREAADYFYKPKTYERLFEAKLELIQVFDSRFVMEGLKLVGVFIEVYKLDSDNKLTLLKHKHKSVHFNKVYINFEIPENFRDAFVLHVYNPVSSGVSIAVDLLNGSFKLMNLNEFFTDIAYPGEKAVYEIMTNPGQMIFTDLRVCSGEVNVTFSETDPSAILGKNTPVSHQTVTYNHRFVHTVNATGNSLFFWLQSDLQSPTVYSLNFVEKERFVNDPYQALVEGNGGTIEVDMDEAKIIFHQVKLNTFDPDKYTHQITYTLYVSESSQVVRFARNCDSFLLEPAGLTKFPLYKSVTMFIASTKEEAVRKPILTLKLPQLPKGKKYHGMLTALVEFLPRETGFLTPLKSARVYYDEFRFQQSVVVIRFALIIVSLMLVGLFAALVVIVKENIFGGLRNYKERARRMESELDQEIATEFGFDVIGILEYKAPKIDLSLNEVLSSRPPQRLVNAEKESLQDIELKGLQES